MKRYTNHLRKVLAQALKIHRNGIRRERVKKRVIPRSNPPRVNKR